MDTLIIKYLFFLIFYGTPIYIFNRILEKKNPNTYEKLKNIGETLSPFESVLFFIYWNLYLFFFLGGLQITGLIDILSQHLGSQPITIKLLNTLSVSILSISILIEKKVYNTRILLCLLSTLITYFDGGTLGLIPTTILSTLESKGRISEKITNIQMSKKDILKYFFLIIITALIFNLLSLLISFLISSYFFDEDLHTEKIRSNTKNINQISKNSYEYSNNKEKVTLENFKSTKIQSDYINKIIKSAELGNVESINFLGAYYLGQLNDYPIEKPNPKEAIKWFKKSANLGSTNAINQLGYCYYHGVGVLPDFEKSFELWYETSKQNSAYGQYMLSLLYLNDQGISHNDPYHISNPYSISTYAESSDFFTDIDFLLNPNEINAIKAYALMILAKSNGYDIGDSLNWCALNAGGIKIAQQLAKKLFTNDDPIIDYRNWNIKNLTTEAIYVTWMPQLPNSVPIREKKRGITKYFDYYDFSLSDRLYLESIGFKLNAN